MSNSMIGITVRTKKLGVLIRDARQAARQSAAACAQAIGADEATFSAYENGEASPSLPELELLALKLGIPLEHFWGSKSRSEDGNEAKRTDVEQLLELRQRMIGMLLRQARTNAGLDLETAAAKADLAPADLEAYEFGQRQIPLPVLEILSGALNRSVMEFIDRKGPVGAWRAQQAALKGYLELPDGLQSFVSKPINRPYLELAERMSEMSVEKLRTVAEILLEITL